MNDLFSTPELLPLEVQAILDKYEESDFSYESCGNLVAELEEVGYTCDYGLDATPYDLRKVLSKKEFALNQIKLQERIQSQLMINVVNCGGCGSVVFYEINVDFDFECSCGFRSGEPSDCPDFWYRGQELNYEDEPIKKGICIEDVVRVATDLKMNPSISEMKEVLKYYDSEERENPSWNWSEIVENLLYNCITSK